VLIKICELVNSISGEDENYIPTFCAVDSIEINKNP
jgi:hypothetical protein